ncbi:MAG: isochorismate synthase [Chloroflexi bacterium]|nr:isochorismate synthase [Chloroflexota bacterium]MBI3170595.1 isochorismate synthase [Chloroflexota bacterium]
MNRITNYTISCRPTALTDFLRFGSGMERFYFESKKSPVAIAGLGVAAQVDRHGKNRFADLGSDLREFFQRIVQVNDSDSHPRPILLGGGSFFDQVQPGEWDPFPSARLVLPRYVLIRIGEEYFFSVNQAQAEYEAIRIEAETFMANYESTMLPPPSIPDEIINSNTSSDEWNRIIQRSIAMIREGRLKKIVMARPVYAHGNRAVDVPAMLEHLGETCPSCFRFMFEFQPGTIFSGATPERLVSVSGAKFKTAALAGSIRRGDFPREDETLGQQLLDSAKDQSEHHFVVEQIREKMLPLANSLNIDPEPRLMRLPNIFHLRTNITGTLHPNQNIMNIIAALHPTPAVGGVPSEAALNAIRELEGFERGWYAAPIGWVDANGDGDFVVAIRSGLFRDKEITLFGGAGIVANSDPQKEWDETGLKIRFLLNALQGEMA